MSAHNDAPTASEGSTWKHPARRRQPLFADSVPASLAVAFALVVGCIAVGLCLGGLW